MVEGELQALDLAHEARRAPDQGGELACGCVEAQGIGEQPTHVIGHRFDGLPAHAHTGLHTSPCSAKTLRKRVVWSPKYNSTWAWRLPS